MTIEFKNERQVTKNDLLEAGRVCLEAIERAKVIQDFLDQYNQYTIFDDKIEIQTEDINNHLSLVHTKLGEIELETQKEKKK